MPIGTMTPLTGSATLGAGLGATLGAGLGASILTRTVSGTVVEGGVRTVERVAERNEELTWESTEESDLSESTTDTFSMSVGLGTGMALGVKVTSTVTHFHSPSLDHAPSPSPDFALPNFENPVLFKKWVGTIPSFDKVIQGSSTFRGLVDRADEGLKIRSHPEWKTITYSPKSHTIHLGMKHPVVGNRASLAVYLAHELFHAEDVLVTQTADKPKDATFMSVTAEESPFYVMMQVAAELHQASLHDGLSLNLGPRRFDSATFLKETDGEKWMEMMEYIRTHIGEKVIEEEGGTKFSYDEYYARQNQALGDNPVFEDAYETRRDLLQKEILHRARAELPYTNLPAIHQKLIAVLIDQVLAGEKDVRDLADALFRIQVRLFPQSDGFYHEEKSLDDFIAFQRGTIERKSFVEQVIGKLKTGNPDVDAERVQVFTINFNLLQEDKTTRIMARNMHLMANKISDTSGGWMRMVWSNGGYKMMIWIPSPRFLELALKHANPGRNFDLLYDFGRGETPVVPLQGLRARDIYTVSQPWTEAWLSDVSGVMSGWFMMIHDFYHLAVHLEYQNSAVAVSSQVLAGFDQLPSRFGNLPFMAQLKKYLSDLPRSGRMGEEEVLLHVWDTIYLHLLIESKDPEVVKTYRQKIRNITGNKVKEAHEEIVAPWTIDKFSRERIHDYADFASTFLKAMGETINDPLLTPLKNRIEADRQTIAAILERDIFDDPSTPPAEFLFHSTKTPPLVPAVMEKIKTGQPIEPISVSGISVRFLNSKHFEPAELIRRLKSNPLLSELVSMPVLRGQPLTLEQHTLTVMRQFEKYQESFVLPPGVSRGFIRLLLSLHDMGKPMTLEAENITDQNDYNLPLIRQVMTSLGFGERLINLAETLVASRFGNIVAMFRHLSRGIPEKGNQEAEGKFWGPWTFRFGFSAKEVNEFRKEGEEKETLGSLTHRIHQRAKEVIEEGAGKAGIRPLDFLRLAILLHQVDASSYTAHANGGTSLHTEGSRGLDELFVFDDEAGTLSYKPFVQRHLFHLTLSVIEDDPSDNLNLFLYLMDYLKDRDPEIRRMVTDEIRDTSRDISYEEQIVAAQNLANILGGPPLPKSQLDNHLWAIFYLLKSLKGPCPFDLFYSMILHLQGALSTTQDEVLSAIGPIVKKLDLPWATLAGTLSSFPEIFQERLKPFLTIPDQQTLQSDFMGEMRLVFPDNLKVLADDQTDPIPPVVEFGWNADSLLWRHSSLRPKHATIVRQDHRFYLMNGNHDGVTKVYPGGCEEHAIFLPPEMSYELHEGDQIVFGDYPPVIFHRPDYSLLDPFWNLTDKDGFDGTKLELRTSDSQAVILPSYRGVHQVETPFASVAMVTDAGLSRSKRLKVNEDGAGIVHLRDGSFVVISADGMGGHGFGDFMMKQFLIRVCTALMELDPTDSHFLEQALQKAHASLMANQATSTLLNKTAAGTAFSMAHVGRGENQAVIRMASLGDATAVLYSTSFNGEVIRTRDHSTVQNFREESEQAVRENDPQKIYVLKAKNNFITNDDEQRRHPQAHILTKAFYAQKNLNPVSVTEDLTVDDNADAWLVLASDGLWDNFSKADVWEKIKNAASAKEAAGILKQAVLEKMGDKLQNPLADGKFDNLSIGVVKLGKSK